MDATTRLIAREALHRHKQNVAAYERDVHDWFTTGDGRSPRWHTYVVDTDDGPEVVTDNVGGKGYAYPACPHGMSRWTDYDNICGPCEDPRTPYELALMEAHDVAREWHRRTDTLAVLQAHQRDFTPDAWKQIVDWAYSPLDPYFRTRSERTNDATTRRVNFRYANTMPTLAAPSFEDREAQAHYDDTWS